MICAVGIWEWFDEKSLVGYVTKLWNYCREELWGVYGLALWANYGEKIWTDYGSYFVFATSVILCILSAFMALGLLCYAFLFLAYLFYLCQDYSNYRSYDTEWRDNIDGEVFYLKYNSLKTGSWRLAYISSLRRARTLRDQNADEQTIRRLLRELEHHGQVERMGVFPSYKRTER